MASKAERRDFDLDQRLQGRELEMLNDFGSQFKSTDLCSIEWDDRQHSYAIEFTIPGEFSFFTVGFAVEGGKIKVLSFSSCGA